jgi:serine/threonine protein kinase
LTVALYSSSAAADTPERIRFKLVTTMKCLTESEKLEICGRYFHKKKGESYLKLAKEYGCCNTTIQNICLRIMENPVSLAAAKIAAENYYSRTAEAHHHNHVGSTAVPGHHHDNVGSTAVPFMSVSESTIIESERLEIGGRYICKKRGESYRTLAAEYGCSEKAIQQVYQRCLKDAASLAAAKIAAENYYSRTAEAYNHDHVGSTAVPGQLLAARACPAPAGRQDKASNAAAAAQPSPPLPHGGGAAARAPDALDVAKSSSVSADLVLRVQRRRPHGDDARRIIALLERNCIYRIQDLTEFGESDFDVSEWGNRADIDAVLLDDSAWETAYWPEKFIRGILGDSTQGLLALQADVLCEFDRAGIQSESDLREKHATLKLAMLPRVRIRQWVKSLGSPDIRDDEAAPSTACHANGSGLAEPAAEASLEIVTEEQSPRDSGQDAAAHDENYHEMPVTPTRSGAVPSAASAPACISAVEVAGATDQMRVEIRDRCVFDYPSDSGEDYERAVAAPPWLKPKQVQHKRESAVVSQHISPCETASEVAVHSGSLSAAYEILGKANRGMVKTKVGVGDLDVDRGAVVKGGGGPGCVGVGQAISEDEQGGGDGGHGAQHDGAGRGDVGEDVSASLPMHSSLLEAFRSHAGLARKVDTPRSPMNSANMQILDNTIKSIALTAACRKRNFNGEHPPGSPVQREYAVIGRGGFGIAILVKSTQSGIGHSSVYKLEFSRADETPQDLALCREYQLYSSFSSGSNDEPSPLPRLGNTLAGYSFVTIRLSQYTTVRILEMEYLSDWPQNVLKTSTQLFSCELRLDHDGREVLLQMLAAILYLDSRGIQHNDLKPQHFFGRGSQIVLIDYGIARTKSLTYKIKDSTCTGRQVQLAQGAHSFEPPRFVKDTPIRILGAPEGIPGTPGFRPPPRYPGVETSLDQGDPGIPGNVIIYHDGGNIGQYGMILLSVICPHLFDGDRPASEDFAKSFLTLPPARWLEEVLRSIVDARARTAQPSAISTRRARRALGAAVSKPQLHQPFGVDIVILCQEILNGKIRQASQAYASTFVRRYIPTSMEWFNSLCAHGLVVEPYDCVKNPLVIVWDKERGFEVLNLFSFDQGESVLFYIGFLRSPDSGAKPTPQSYSFHSIKRSENILDGTPGKVLTIEVMARHAAPGALVGSSRRHHRTQCPGKANLTSPQIPSAKEIQVHLEGGEVLHSVDMRGSKPTPFGSLTMWNYDWASQGAGIPVSLTEEEIEEAAKIRESMPRHWWDIIRKRRQEFLAKGYRDAIFKQSCSIRACCCEQNSTKEAKVFQFHQLEDTKQCLEACGSLGAPKSRVEYWEMPADMNPDARQSATVYTNFIDPVTGVVDTTKREVARREVQDKLDAKGLVILDNFFGSWREGRRRYAKAKAMAGKMQFNNVVSLNVPTKGGRADPSDRTKTMTDGITVVSHPVRRALGLVGEHYLPGMVVSEGADVKSGDTVSECAVLNQNEVEHHATLRGNGVDSTVHQILHTDKEMFTVLGKPRDPENLNRSNLAFFMDNQGPLSIWAPLVDEGQFLSLVGYLGSHKLALALWVFMAQHYAKMKEAYRRGRTETEVNDDEFLRVWIGAARLFMRREYPDERIVAERIRAKCFDVLLVHGLLVHGGTDEVGLRMFAGYSPVVSVAPINL